MEWFNIQIFNKGFDELIFEMPIQAPMHNSANDRFYDFVEKNPEYQALLDMIGEHDIRAEHMHHHLVKFRAADA
jgi:hypothetical protein